MREDQGDRFIGPFCGPMNLSPWSIFFVNSAVFIYDKESHWINRMVFIKEETFWK